MAGGSTPLITGAATPAHIPVIALTADAMPEAVQQGLAAGYFRYLTKPIAPAELLKAVDEALAYVRSRHQAA